MVYYSLHSPNRELYVENLIGMLKELKMRGQFDKLRREITKYFVDKTSEYYENDGEIRKKVREIGGNIIQ